VAKVADHVRTKINELENVFSNQHTVSCADVGSVLTVEDAVLHRSLIVFLLFTTNKVCRRMQYYSLDVSTWNKLSRDDKGRKIYHTDQFKTADTFGIDTILFDKEIEQHIDAHIKYARPLLAAQAPVGAPAPDALFLSRTGSRYIRLSEDVQRVFRITIKKDISITTLRKVFATESYAHLNYEERQVMARSDTHSMSTVKVYVRDNMNA
jgi:hypothetical protein